MKMLLLFSHQLTQEQKEQAYSMGVSSFVPLPSHLQKIWSNVPPNEKDIVTYLYPVKEWFEQAAKKNDIALIQGDFGACYHMANFAKSLDVTAVYATTQRVVEEKTIDNKNIKRSIFKHVIFREYL